MEEKKSVNNHYVVVGGKVDSVPRHRSSASVEALLKGLREDLMGVMSGWAFVFIDGEACKLSAPTQVFSLQMASGQIFELKENDITFSEDGQFQCLVNPDQPL
jgi:hypothetical protein